EMDRRMCDIILEAEGKEFLAHRTLLACSSDYFWSMFQDHTLESGAHTVSLPALTSVGLEQVLDFIYTSWISLSPSTLEDTLEAACYLQITDAVDLCTEYISDSLSLDNCCFFANVAARYGLSEAVFALDWLGCNPLPALESPLQPLVQSVHTSLRATTNRILLVGGGREADRPQTQIQSFDERSRKFHKLSITMPKKLQYQGICVVGNFLFVLGGEVVEVDAENEKTAVMTVSDQVWRYDPRFDRWEEMEPLLQKRAQFSCCVVNGVIYAIGGRGQRGEPALSSVERYDMKAGCWRSGVALPHAVHGQACATINRGIYISGGIHSNQPESSKELLFLNTHDSDAWERRSAMSIARFGHQMATIKECIYAFLGMYEPFCDIERYDPAQDQWTRLKPLLHDRFCYGLTVTAGGRALMFGGRKWQDGQEVCTPDVLEYDPEYDSWKKVCKLPGPLCGTQCAVMTISELIEK
uniref:Kelch like family member 34 n=1 Tax=Astyanax mexicanus TaxID=7994 RepID=A0A8B9KTY6_ASTMX